MGAVPCQLPGSADSVWPCTAAPEMVGEEVLVGRHQVFGEFAQHGGLEAADPDEPSSAANVPARTAMSMSRRGIGEFLEVENSFDALVINVRLVTRLGEICLPPSRDARSSYVDESHCVEQRWRVRLSRIRPSDDSRPCLEIAIRRHRSGSIVSHRRAIQAKLGARNLPQAVAIAYESGVLPLGEKGLPMSASGLGTS
jgi:hypothetical protein